MSTLLQSCSYLQGQVFGIPEAISDTVRQWLVRLVRGEDIPGYDGQQAVELPLADQRICRERTYRDSCYGFLASMYVQLKLTGDRKLSTTQVADQMKNYTKDQVLFLHTSRETGVFTSTRDKLKKCDAISIQQNKGKPI